MKLFPQIFAFERHFGIIDDAVLFGLDGPQGSNHARMVVVGGDRRQHHVFSCGVRMPPRQMVRMMGVSQLGYERARVAAVRALRAESGQRRRREETSGGWRRSRLVRRRTGGGGKQRTDAKVRLSG